MHILIITPGQFMTQKLPNANLFQLHQAIALHSAGHKVGILSSAFVPGRYTFSTYPYQKIDSSNGFPILRKYQRQIIPTRYKTVNTAVNSYKKIGYNLYLDYTKHYGKPDIIHAHNFKFGGFIAQAIKEKDDVPFILTEHSTWHSRNLFSTKDYFHFQKCAQQASSISAVSNPFATLLTSKLNYKVEVLPNIIDTHFKKITIKNKANKLFTLINIASLNRKKDHQLLLHSFSKAFKGQPAVLKIAGTGELLNKLKQLSIRLGIASQVKFLGRLDRAAVKKNMLEADCFVLSSQYETFGVVLIEALACGLPIIATRCGGPEDIVNDRNGLLVNVSSIDQMSKAMLQVYNNISMYNPYDIIADVNNRFGSATFVKMATTFYRRAINEN